MTTLQIIFLGIVEGITEFLPVSSTAHLYITSNILRIPSTPLLSTFIIAIQIGALIAGAIFIFRTLSVTKKVFINASLAFIPTAIIGFFAYPYIKNILLGNNMLIIAVALILGGIAILFIDKDKNQENEEKELSYKDSFIFGLIQTLAFIPGVSRSGSLIIGGKLLKYSRKSIVIFTFLLGLPTLAAATLYDLYKSREILSAALGFEILLGAIVSGVVAYIVARWFLKYITNHTFKIFGWYRIAVGAVMLIALYLSN